MARDKAVEQPVEAKRELALMLMDPALTIPADVRAQLTNLALDEGSPVQACVTASEVIYAREADLPADLVALGAEIATLNANFNFHGMGGANGRGYAIAATLKERSDVAAKIKPSGKKPAKPEPDSRFRKPEAAPAEAAGNNAKA